MTIRAPAVLTNGKWLNLCRPKCNLSFLVNAIGTSVICFPFLLTARISLNCNAFQDFPFSLFRMNWVWFCNRTEPWSSICHIIGPICYFGEWGPKAIYDWHFYTKTETKRRLWLNGPSWNSHLWLEPLGNSQKDLHLIHKKGPRYHHGTTMACGQDASTWRCFRDIEPWCILICFVILGRFLLPFGGRD